MKDNIKNTENIDEIKELKKEEIEKVSGGAETGFPSPANPCSPAGFPIPIPRPPKDPKSSIKALEGFSEIRP